jgi:hypothetical protein
LKSTHDYHFLNVRVREGLIILSFQTLSRCHPFSFSKFGPEKSSILGFHHKFQFFCRVLIILFSAITLLTATPCPAN